jgi:hypothetical protein
LIDWILRRNCLLKHVIEGKIDGRVEVTGRRRIRSKQLLNEIKETGGYCKSNRGSIRSPSVEKSLLKRVWTCQKADRGRIEGVKYGGLLYF